MLQPSETGGDQVSVVVRRRRATGTESGYGMRASWKMKVAARQMTDVNPDADALHSRSDVGRRAVQRRRNDGPSRTRRSAGLQSGGRWRWKRVRNRRRPFALSTILRRRLDGDSKKRIRSFVLRTNWERGLRRYRRRTHP